MRASDPNHGRVPAASVLVTLLFSVLAAGVRAGTVYSIKMLLEHQCAFVNYTRGEDCHRAIQHLDVRTRSHFSLLINKREHGFFFLIQRMLHCCVKSLGDDSGGGSPVGPISQPVALH